MEAELSRLRERATEVLGGFNGQHPQRPLFVEFSGSPKSGKSTCIDIIAHFLRRTGFSVLAPTEGASKRTPYYLKSDWMAFNTWSACYALTHVLEGLYHSDKYHLAILDRGLFDALAWFEFLTDEGTITTEDRDKVHQFLLIEKWRSVIDCVFLFTANPDTSMDRENKDKLISDLGSAMNPDVLGRLNNAYESTREKYANTFPMLVFIDTSEDHDTTPQSTAIKIADRILDLFHSEQQ